MNPVNSCQPEPSGFSRYCVHGHTLPELLTVLAIIAILLLMTLPLLSPAGSSEAEQVFERFARTVSIARAQAIRRQQTLVLCPLSDASSCGSDWTLGMLLFADKNQDGNLSADEAVLERIHWQESLENKPVALTGTLQWRAFGNRQRLRISSLGEISDQNGNLLWCPPPGSTVPPHQLILNATGRIRLARDNDGDGRREDSQGNPLSC
ncbi:MAG TPA: GspH/FimT family pseudopilin [Pseudohongiella sp.]|nr:GspH/FimT family pseudopilin [Pseudohongiella sp.]